MGTPSILLALVVALIVAGCSKQATPEGGPYDMVPPRLVKANPPVNATNVHTKKIKLKFDENVALERQSEKVVFTPPQKSMPKLEAGTGRTITIKFEEDLLPNTTYVVDFSDAIVDLNERNPLEGFSYAFSTGDHIDTLVLSGRILDAHTLQPLPLLSVGIYKDYKPGDEKTQLALRLTKSTDEGNFRITHVAEGSYHIFGFNDIDRSNNITGANEGIAFLTTPVTPYLDTLTSANDSLGEVAPRCLLLYSNKVLKQRMLQKGERPDSATFKLSFSVAPDTLPELRLLYPKQSQGAINHLLPEFVKGQTQLLYHITDTELRHADSLSMQVCYPSIDTLGNPIVKCDTVPLKTKKVMMQKVEKKYGIFGWLIPNKDKKENKEKNAKNDKRENKRDELSLPSDSTALAADSLPPLPPPTPLKVQLLPQDKLREGHPQTPVIIELSQLPIEIDTACIQLYQLEVPEQPAGEADSLALMNQIPGDSTASKPSVPTPVNNSALLGGASNPYGNTPQTEQEESAPNNIDVPAPSSDSTAQANKELPRVPVPFRLLPMPSHCRRYIVQIPEAYNHRYVLAIDSAAIMGVAGAVAPATELSFTVKKQQEYASLNILLDSFPSNKTIYFELLNDTDSVLYSHTVKDSIQLEEITPATYFARIWVDENNNHIWDAAEYPIHEPETTYYYPKPIALQPGKQERIVWNPTKTPLYRQRPKEMKGKEIKDAAKEEKRERKNLNEEYIQRMRERHGDKWNPSDSDRKLLGLPSQAEEKAAREAEKAKQAAQKEGQEAVEKVSDKVSESTEQTEQQPEKPSSNDKQVAEETQAKS